MVVTPIVTQVVRDGGLGAASTPDILFAVIGAASAGSDLDYLLTTDKNAIVDKFGSGMMPELAAYTLQSGKDRNVAVLALKAHASVAGAAGAVTKSAAGTTNGTMTVSGAPTDAYDVVVVSAVTATVASGNLAVQVSLDGGDSYSDIVAVPTSGSYPIPGIPAGTSTGLTLTFTDGSSPSGFTKGDQFAFKCVGPGMSSTDVGAAFDAVAALPYVWQRIILAGVPASAAASATIAALLDTKIQARAAANYPAGALMHCGLGLKNGAVTASGGAAAASDITLSGNPNSSTASYQIKVTTGGARGTMKYQFSTNGGTSWNGSDITSPSDGSSQVLAGTGVSVSFANAVTFSASPQNIYSWLPVAEGDADAIAAFANFSSVDGRVEVSAGDCELLSAVTNGRYYTRPDLFLAAGEMARSEISEDLGKVERGAVPGIRPVNGIKRDERVTPGFLQGRFITTKTWEGRSGYFLVTGPTMAPQGSDFSLTQYRQIVDAAESAVYQTLVSLANSDVRTKPADGTIAEADAVKIEAKLNAALATAIGDHVTTFAVQVRRDINVQTTQKLRTKTRIVAFGYIKDIQNEIGLTSVL